MSLFVTGLTFADAPALLTPAKLGILAGSLVAGLVGGLLVRRSVARERG